MRRLSRPRTSILMVGLRTPSSPTCHSPLKSIDSIPFESADVLQELTPIFRMVSLCPIHCVFNVVGDVALLSGDHEVLALSLRRILVPVFLRPLLIYSGMF